MRRSDHLPTPELSPSSEPIEIPSLNAWRWRVQRLLRLSETGCRHPSSDRSLVSYLLNSIAEDAKKGEGVYSTRSAQLSSGNVSYRLTDEYDLSQQEEPLHTLLKRTVKVGKGRQDLSKTPRAFPDTAVEINDPAQLVSNLSKVAYVRFPTRWGGDVYPIRDCYLGRYEPSFVPSILPGFARALKATQDGSIWEIAPGVDAPWPHPATAPSFNALTEAFGRTDGTPEQTRPLVEQYLVKLDKGPMAGIVEPSNLHAQYARVFEDFQVPRG